MKMRFILPLAAVLIQPAALSAQTWTDWESYATGTYDAHYWYRSPMRDLPVYRRVQESNPNREQYKVEGLFGQTPGCAPIDLVIDVNRDVQGPTQADFSMWVDDQYVESFDVYGKPTDIYLCDGYTYYDTYFPENPEYAMQYEDASYYREETGTFNIYAYYHYPDGTVPFLDSFYQERAQGPETLTLKGPQFKDYTCTVSGMKIYQTAGGAEMEANVDIHDLGKVRLCLVTGVANDVRSVAERLNRGEGEYAELTESGVFRLNAGNVRGYHTLVYLTYKPDGTAYQFGSEEYEYDPDWRHMGTGMFTDGFISKFLEHDMTVNHGYQFEESDFTYPVEVEVSTVYPGRYRVVNPYGETSPYWNLDFSVLTLNRTKNHYMVISAFDPEKVSIPYFNSGFYYSAEPLVLYSEAFDYIMEGYEDGDVPENLWGKLENGLISFPDGEEGAGVLCAKIQGSPADIWGRCLKLQLPGASGVRVQDSTAHPEIWFDLQGRKVTDRTVPGIYIIKSATSTRKVIIR